MDSQLGAQPTLAGILGPEQIRTLGFVRPDAGAPADQGGAVESMSPAEKSSWVFAQVRKVVESLQEQLQESEPLVAELQDKADNLEEKRMLLLRRAERAERDRDVALRRCSEVEGMAKQLREEAAPVVARFMEAEVLRSQLQASGEELVRLKQELVSCRDELREGLPRLAELEDDEAECEAAIAQLKAAHTEEVVVLKSIHMEELADLRSQHAAKVAELEAAKVDQVTTLKRSSNEELSQLRSALESARWQAEVYVREQQDAIREVCLRQRENARLAKKHGETRQEALELAVRLEALKAAEAGAPAREAELQAVRRRYALLQQTAAEWREALSRKQGDCDAWRRRAELKGVPMSREDDDLQAEMRALTLPSPSQRRNPHGRGNVLEEDLANNDLSMLSAASPSPIPVQRRQSGGYSVPWSGVPTPARTPLLTPSRRLQHNTHHLNQQQTLQRKPPPMQHQQRGRPLGHEPSALLSRSRSFDGFAAGIQRVASAPVPLPPSRRPPMHLSHFSSGFASDHASRGTFATGRAGDGYAVRAPSQHPAGELVAVVMKAAKLREEAELTSGRESCDTAGDAGEGMNALGGGPLPAGVDHQSNIGRMIVEAENEVEMLTFLLEEVDSSEAEVLLELEAQQHQKHPVVAARLRAQISELTARRRRSRSPPELTS
eukprot:TRINITY_DN16096_c0_g2_i1.p1 TRINITY_DN16096_c0_g2~~TRINITY_DN16096_c0_g2_i1.p1  ORF type:complete len:666 (+),score=164.91 TRINITY_DN16096_c0_g2_i1:161-2158(+)